VHGDVGWSCWTREGAALPQRTIDLVAAHGLVLFGAITSKPKHAAQQALPPELRGAVYESPVLALRRRFELATSLRPCRSFPGHPAAYVRKGKDGLEEPHVDVELVTQATECHYAGLEWADDDVAMSVRVLTRAACTRIAEVAFARARRRRRRVVLVDKWGVLQETAGLFLAATTAAHAAFPDVELATMNFDAAVHALARKPDAFDVVLSSALVGDVLSDGFAALTGGMGMAPSASLGSTTALFEPSHGSAPRIDREPHIANPIATILAAAMLLDHIGEAPRADAIRAAVAKVIADGRVRTYDLHGDATTEEMAAAIAAAI
jgi:isocitrate dehydrogenase (NAD+)